MVLRAQGFPLCRERYLKHSGQISSHGLCPEKYPYFYQNIPINSRDIRFDEIKFYNNLRDEEEVVLILD